MDVIALEYGLSGARELKKMLGAYTDKPLIKQAATFPTGVKCARVLDGYEQAYYDKRAETLSESGRNRLSEFEKEKQKEFLRAGSLDELKSSAERAISELRSFRKEREPLLKIGVAGDIYTVIDPFMNRNIQKRLADMGAYTARSMSISGWLEDKLKIKKWTYDGAAQGILPEKIGGFAKETVGSAAKWAKEGFDGIIELYPLNCMPESVARNLLPSVSKKYGRPVLSIVADEHSGEAGYITRLEAFTQMIERRKEKK